MSLSQRPCASPARMGGKALAAHAVREALHAVAAPRVATRVLDRALHLAQEAAVPSRGQALRVFVHQHLAGATRFVLGEDAAEQVVDSLRSIVDRVPTISSIPTADPEARHPSFASGVAPRLRTVLLASFDRKTRDVLSARLAGEASLRVIDDVVALLDALELPSLGATIIIIDCRDPSVQPETLATVADQLPPTTRVLLWGATRQQEREATEFVSNGHHWRRLERSDAEQVAELVLAMLGT